MRFIGSVRQPASRALRPIAVELAGQARGAIKDGSRGTGLAVAFSFAILSLFAVTSNASALQPGGSVHAGGEQSARAGFPPYCSLNTPCSPPVTFEDICRLHSDTDCAPDRCTRGGTAFVFWSAARANIKIDLAQKIKTPKASAALEFLKDKFIASRQKIQASYNLDRFCADESFDLYADAGSDAENGLGTVSFTISRDFGSLAKTTRQRIAVKVANWVSKRLGDDGSVSAKASIGGHPVSVKVSGTKLSIRIN